MAEKREWTMVSDLVGEIHFSVSGGKEGTKDYIPPTSGFVIRVSYAKQYDVLKEALNSTRIAVQNTMRTYYRKNGRFPFAPGKVQQVNGEGEFSLPVASQIDRLEAQKRAGLLGLDDRIRMAQMAGFVMTEEMIVMIKAQMIAEGMTIDESVETDDSAEDENAANDEASPRYDVTELQKLGTPKLRILAQKEELEGYDTRPRNELIDLLSELVK